MTFVHEGARPNKQSLVLTETSVCLLPGVTNSVANHRSYHVALINLRGGMQFPCFRIDGFENVGPLGARLLHAFVGPVEKTAASQMKDAIT